MEGGSYSPGVGRTAQHSSQSPWGDRSTHRQAVLKKCKLAAVMSQACLQVPRSIQSAAVALPGTAWQWSNVCACSVGPSALLCNWLRTQRISDRRAWLTVCSGVLQASWSNPCDPTDHLRYVHVEQLCTWNVSVTEYINYQRLRSASSQQLDPSSSSSYRSNSSTANSSRSTAPQAIHTGCGPSSVVDTVVSESALSAGLQALQAYDRTQLGWAGAPVCCCSRTRVDV